MGKGLNLSVSFFQEGVDPDSFAKQYGQSTAVKLNEIPRKSLFDFYIDCCLEEEGLEQGKSWQASTVARVATKIVKSLAPVTNEVEKGLLIERCARRFAYC